MLTIERSGAQPILRRWRGGAPEYHTLFFARTARGFTSLTDLAGKKIAFDEPVSTTGHLLPLAYLMEKNLNPVEKKYLRQAVAKNEVGYIFSGDDENTAHWIVEGKGDSGAISNLDFDDLPKDLKEDLRIIWESNQVPRQLVIQRSDANAEQVSKVKEILLSMHETEEGLEILDDFKHTSKYTEFSHDEKYEEILNMLKSLPAGITD